MFRVVCLIAVVACVSPSAVRADAHETKKKIAVPVALAAQSSSCSVSCSQANGNTLTASASGAGAVCGAARDSNGNPIPGFVGAEAGQSGTACNCTNGALTFTFSGGARVNVPAQSCASR